MISIVIPTYNESKNILKTIKGVEENIPRGLGYEIIVVDDNSPDRTWEVVKNSNIKKAICIRRMKDKGLSSAVVEGFRKSSGELLIVMDGDGQHDETKIPRMIEESNNYDIIIGSRFVKGGKVFGRNKKRNVESIIAIFLANLLIKQHIKDPMSGFFLIKKKHFEKVEHKLECIGYKILLDILFNLRNATVKEIPIIFKSRKYGESKLGLKVMIEYIIMVIKLSFRSITRKVFK